MDKVFIENVDVYVDDMLIKSRSEATLLCDVEETLQTLTQAQMKLNLGKMNFQSRRGPVPRIPYNQRRNQAKSGQNPKIPRF